MGQPEDPRVGATAALAELGQHALNGAPLAELLDKSAQMMACELQADQVDVLERVAGGLRLRACRGSADVPVGTTFDMPPNGYAAAVFASDGVVVSEDLARETQFVASPVLLEAGVVSAMAVTIPGDGGGRPYGLIGVHCTSRRSWTREEIDLVRNVAHIAGGAIARRRQALELNDDILQALVVTRYAIERDRLDTARETLDSALAAAREMISSLLGDEHDPGEALPGDLRRS